VRGLYITSVDYVYADAGIYTPERVGIAQFCGAAAEGMPREAAANMALRCMVAIEAVIANYPHARLANPGLEQELDSAIQELEKHRRIFAESKEQITTEKVDRKKQEITPDLGPNTVSTPTGILEEIAVPEILKTPPTQFAPRSCTGTHWKRQAHYVTLKFANGKTDDGAPVSLSAKDHVRVTGYLGDASYSESLTTFLRKVKQFERIQDRDDERRVGRVATYVVVKTLIRFT